jgi:hypothetical protein
MGLLARGGLLVLLLATGCTRAPAVFDYTEEHVALHAVVAAGMPTVSAMVTRFTPGTRALQPVSGVELQLLVGTDTLPFAEVPLNGISCTGEEALAESFSGAGCYRATVPGGVRAGGSYALRARFPNGQVATGALTVPEVPTLLAPSGEVRVGVRNRGQILIEQVDGIRASARLASFPVRWTRPEGAARIEVMLGAGTVFRGGQRVPGAQCMLRQTGGAERDVIAFDSLTLALFEVSCRQGGNFVAWDSIQARLAVTAFDSAYARYADEVLDSRRREAVRAPRVSAGIQGVLGLFAGAAAATRDVMLIALPD